MSGDHAAEIEKENWRISCRISAIADQYCALKNPRQKSKNIVAFVRSRPKYFTFPEYLTGIRTLNLAEKECQQSQDHCHLEYLQGLYVQNKVSQSADAKLLKNP